MGVCPAAVAILVLASATGDAMTYHNGWTFTVWDRDSDVALSSCALTHRAVLWYKNCHLANLNRKYGENKHSEGMNREPWKGHEFSILFTEMKIHPQSSSNKPTMGRKKRSVSGKRNKIRAELCEGQYPKIMIQYFLTS